MAGNRLIGLCDGQRAHAVSGAENQSQLPPAFGSLSTQPRFGGVFFSLQIAPACQSAWPCASRAIAISSQVQSRYTLPFHPIVIVEHPRVLAADGLAIRRGLQGDRECAL